MIKREDAFVDLDPEVPLALLPVRLETRWLAEGDQGFLGIRIYPDTIHADDHHPGVTEREINAGITYWNSVWAVDGDDPVSDEAVSEARSWLAGHVGDHRAVYVADQLRPTNVDKPVGPPEFPKVEASPTGPITARLMPDEWLVRAYGPGGGLVYEEYVPGPGDGLVMAPSLVAGHDSTTEDPRGAVRGFLDDQDLRWVVDFDDARKAGMAIRIPRSQLPARLSTLLVIGVRHDRKPVAEATVLFEVFDGHRFTRGLDVVPQGTPTNNSDAGRSGFSLDRPDLDRLFDIADRPGPGAKRALLEYLIQAPATLYAAKGADAVSLALGHVAPNALDWTKHANWADGAAAWAMNVGIGYATIGGFLSGPFRKSPGTEENLNEDEDKYTEWERGEVSIPGDTIAELRDWYAAWVRGGAAIPTIRCGEQPYGVMPITSRPRTYEKPTDFRAQLEDRLAEMLDLWRAALPVPSLDPDATDGRPGGNPDDSISDVSAVLGAVPHPTALQLRDVNNWGVRDLDSMTFNIEQIDDNLTILGPMASQEWAASQVCLAAWVPHKAVLQGGTATIDEQYSHAVEWRAELEELRVTQSILTDEIGNSIAYADNIIDYLEPFLVATDELPTILDDVHGREGLGVDGRLILTGLSHQLDALGLQYLVAGDHIDPLWFMRRWFNDARNELTELVADNKLGDRTSHADEYPLLAHLLDITYQSFPEDQLGPVALAFLILSSIAQLDLSVFRPDEEQPEWELGEDPNTVGIYTNPFGGEIFATSTVIEIYERLMRESLGLAMYRLDAWVLSLANERLAQRRKDHPYGSHVGAYGWLVDLEPRHEPTSQGYIHAPSLNHATTAAVLRSGWSAFGTADAEAPLSVDLSSERIRRGQWILDALRNGQDLAEVLGARFERLLHDARLDVYIDQVREAVLEATGEEGPPGAVVDGLVLARASGFDADDRTTREQAVADAIAARMAATAGQERAGWRRVQRAAQETSADLDSVADIVLFQSVHALLRGDDATANASAAISSGADAAIPPITATASPVDGQQVAHRVIALLDDAAPVVATGPAAAAVPAVVAWLESLLPSPQHISFGWAPEGADGFKIHALDTIGVEAVDALLLTGDGVSQGTSDLGRVAAALAAEALGAGTLVASAVAGDGFVSLDEFGLIAARWRDALGRSRELRAADLVTPDLDVTGDRYVASELDDRLAAASALLDDLRTAIGGVDGPSRRAALVQAAALGVAGAVAALELDTDESAADVATVMDGLDARLTDPPPTSDGIERLTNADDAAVVLEQLRVLLGNRLPATVPFDAVVALDDSVSADLAADADPVTWMRQVGRVLPAVGATDEALLLARAAGGAAVPPAIVQLPNAVTPWVATDAPATSGDQLSAVSVSGFGPSTTRLSGLLVDAWSETIPRKDQVTGLAVHFDAPSARPPQTILLSTTPEGTAYKPDELSDQLLFTLELAKIRAVGPLDVGLGQVFPIVYVDGDIDTADDARARAEAVEAEQ